MSKYILYPGCSMQRSARPYLDSTMAIHKDLDVEFEEVRDWNCCGATEYWSLSNIPAYALVGRNLALASQQVNGTNTLVAGCSACYLNLSKTDNYMGKDRSLNASVNEALAAGGLSYKPGTLQVRHLLDIVLNDVGLEAVASKVVKPLTGLRVAPYYGCMIVRPDFQKRYDDPEYPQGMDELLKVLGAEVVDYPLKTHCCGGHMTQISEPTAYEIIRRLLYAAEQYKADMIVALCPMCQMNLDAFQGDVNKHFKTNFHMPVLYFTQLIGLAFGHTAEELGIGREFVDSTTALAKIGVEVPEPAKKHVRHRKDDPSLPMPKPLEKSKPHANGEPHIEEVG
jgi:heterodisulfide reductase subunit B